MTKAPHRPTFRKADADEMSDQDGQTLSPATVEPLGRDGRAWVENRHYTAGPFSIWCSMCHSGMEVTSSQPSNVYVLYIPHSSAMEIDESRKRLASTPGTLLVGNMSSCDKLTIHENCRHIGIAFDKSAMVGQLSKLLNAPVMDDIELCATVETESAVGSRLAGLGNLLWTCFDVEGDDRSTTATDHLFHAAMVMILESIPHNYSARLHRLISPALPRHLKRAIEYMIANISQPLSIPMSPGRPAQPCAGC